MNSELINALISQIGNIVGIPLAAVLAVWQVKKGFTSKRNDEVNEKSFGLCCELFDLVSRNESYNKEVTDTTVKEKEKITKQNKKETKPSSQKNNETTQKGKTKNKKVTTAKKVKKSKKNKNNKSKSSAVTTSSTDAYAAAATATHLHADKPTAKITSTSSSKKTCTITIECKSILDNMDDLKLGHEAYVPKNGIILSEYEATFNGKATVYDLLKKACDDNKIPYNAKTTIYSVYISGINNLDEFDCGGESGWLYYVNGKKPNVSCDSTKLKDGDKVVFSYTCSYNK